MSIRTWIQKRRRGVADFASLATVVRVEQVACVRSWAEDDDSAREGSREWKWTLVDEHYPDPVADPAEVGRDGDDVSDRAFKAGAIVSSDPDTHVKRIRMLEKLGATAICVMNISGNDPLGTLRTYGEHVLPALRAD